MPEALPDIPAPDCSFNLDQFIRMAYQRKQLVEPFREGGLGGNSIRKKAAWLTFTTATDATKIVFSPFFANMVIPQSEGKTDGGNDNSTPFGVEDYVGEQPVKVEYEYRKQHPTVIEALRKFIQESIPTVGLYALTIYLFNKNGQILCIETDNAGVTKHNGLPIFNNRISSRGSQGLNAPDINKAGFSFPAEWDAQVTLITPDDFNPLYDF